MNQLKKKESTNKNDLKKKIEERIKEYDLAIAYFKKNELQLRLVEGEKDKKILVETLEKIKSGKLSEIDEKKLPKEITPEYISGYSNDERIKIYFEIITKIIDEKQKLQTELDNEIKELKKLSKEQIIEMKDELKSDFEKIKNKKIKYDEIINIIKEDFKNKWIPAPLYSEKEEDIEIETINENIAENTLKITFGKTNYMKKDRKVFIRAKLSETNYEDVWEQKDIGDWSHCIKWQLDENEYNDLSNRIFEFEVYEKVKKGEKHKGDGKIELSKLKSENSFKDDFIFNLQTKRMVPKVKILFEIRKCIEPKHENYKKRIFCFTKFYPAFKQDS